MLGRGANAVPVDGVARILTSLALIQVDCQAHLLQLLVTVSGICAPPWPSCLSKCKREKNTK